MDPSRRALLQVLTSASVGVCILPRFQPGLEVDLPAAPRTTRIGGRFGTRRNLVALGGGGTTEALRVALAALVARQQTDGSWGNVGTTALVLPALLGDGHTPRHGAHRDAVERGVGWIHEQQDASGAFGGATAVDGAHLRASLALVEAYTFTRGPDRRAGAQAAVDRVARPLAAALGEVPLLEVRIPPPPASPFPVALLPGALRLLVLAREEARLRVEPDAIAVAGSSSSARSIRQMSPPRTSRVSRSRPGAPPRWTRSPSETGARATS